MIQIPVAVLEFDVHGHTIWVHSPLGATVLRIKTMGKITIEQCQNNPVSHCDLIIQDDINFCLSDDADTGGDNHEPCSPS